MRGKPSVISSIHESYNGILYNIDFTDNLLVLMGDSGEGKSFLWQFFDSLRAIEKYKYISTFNYKDMNVDLSSVILGSSKRLFVIDNADILLNDDLREYIALDYSNQYLLIGRNPRCLLLMNNNLAQLLFDKDKRSFEVCPLFSNVEV